jgi:hypothetical protein
LYAQNCCGTVHCESNVQYVQVPEPELPLLPPELEPLPPTVQ